jgi:hypothetical protein
VDAERTRRSWRLRLALDPEVPDGCFLLLVGDAVSVTAADLVVPRSPVSRLGVHGPSFAGVDVDAQVEAALHYVAFGPTLAEVSSRGALHGVRLPGAAGPVDVTWDGAARGDPLSGIDVRRARLAIGAIEGALRGTWKMFDDGARLTLAWTVDPRACSTGVEKGGGGTFAFDSRDLAATKVDLRVPAEAKGCLPPRAPAARGE